MDSQMLLRAAELNDIYSTLYLVYHRNRNQHRSSKWWKCLSMLKRSAATLIYEMEEDASGDLDIESRIKARVEHIRSQLVPRCYVAFSSVAADNQFSTLGIVLIAILARITKVISIEGEDSTPSRGLDIEVPSYDIATYGDEDVGEIVGRSVYVDVPTSRSPSAALGAAKSEHPAISKKRSKLEREPAETVLKPGKSKKKRKKGNDIDDIFNSLV